MRILFLTLVALSCSSALAVADDQRDPESEARSPLALEEGARVRVARTDAERVTGRVEQLSGSELMLRLDESVETLSIPFGNVEAIEVSTGRRSRGEAAWSKAKWGALIGAVPGAILLGVGHEQVGEDGSSVGEAAALGAWSGGLFGGLAGALIGALRPGEKWENVTPALSIDGVGKDSQLSVGITIRF